MNSLLLGLALTGSPVTAAHPPVVYRPGYPDRVYAPPVVVAPPPAIVPVEPLPRPMTVAEFVRCFQPIPGHHDVWLIHPVTCRPVRVCFNLPPGCGCPKVRVHRREVKFDYGRREVEIRFRHNGTVSVDYD
jgi:hypothetical protein